MAEPSLPTALVAEGLKQPLGIALVHPFEGGELCPLVHATGRRAGVPSKKCPECAEMVQAEAKRCKHCGATLVVTA